MFVDRGAQRGTQPLVDGDVPRSCGTPQGEGVDGLTGTGQAAHHGQFGQRRAQLLQDPAATLREQQRPFPEHDRVAGALGGHRHPRHDRRCELHPEPVGDRAHGGGHVAGGRAHAEAGLGPSPHAQVAADRGDVAPADALGDGQFGGAGRLGPIGRVHHHAPWGAGGERGEHRAGGGFGHGQGDQATGGFAPPVQEDPLEYLAVVAGGLSGSEGHSSASSRYR